MSYYPFERNKRRVLSYARNITAKPEDNLATREQWAELLRLGFTGPYDLDYIEAEDWLAVLRFRKGES